MSSDPTSSPTAARVLSDPVEPMTDAQIKTLRGALAHERSAPRMFLAGLVRSLLATLDAALARASQAEQELTNTRANRETWQVEAEGFRKLFRQREDERDIARQANVEKTVLLAAERQARETAEAERDGVQRISEAAQRSWNEEIARRQRAEAALATERAERQQAWQETVETIAASSQAAPHEPPQQGDG